MIFTDFRVFIFLLAVMMGNATIEGFDLVLCLVLPLLVILCVFDSQFKISSGPVSIFIVTTILIAVWILAYLNVGFVYSLWVVKALFIFLLFHEVRPVTSGQLILVMLFAVLLLLSSGVVEGRSYGLFGPNMLYRFYAVLFVASLAGFIHFGNRPILFFTGLSLGLYGVILTGSIGGVMLVIGAVILFVKPRLRYLVGILAASAFAIIFRSFIIGSPIYGRLVHKFTTGDLSQSARAIGFRELAFAPFKVFGYEHSRFDYLWTQTYAYPHNLILELYIVFGVLGIIVSAFVLVSAFKFVQHMRTGSNGLMMIVFYALLGGSLLSGDLSDNYGVVGLALGIALSSVYRKNRQHQPVPPRGNRMVPSTKKTILQYGNSS